MSGDPVFRRVGGLEERAERGRHSLQVFRRVGGLEGHDRIEQRIRHVFRRVGGLETDAMS